MKNSKQKIALLPYTTDEFKELIKQAISEISKEPDKEKTNQGDEPYLNQKEAAKFLRVSLPTIIKWKKEKMIPYYQRGRTILFKKSELLETMRKNEDLIK